MKNILLIIPLFSYCAFAQEQANSHEVGENHEHHHSFKRHSVTFEFGYTHIPDAFEEVKGDQSVWVPTFGLAYGYQFSHKFKTALMLNMETGNYLINVNREDLNRENVFIISIVGVYELAPNWGIFAGPGIELEKHHNYAVLRFGTEYSFDLKNNLFLIPLITFDYKVDYTSWELALGIMKRF